MSHLTLGLYNLDTIHHGDGLKALRLLPELSVDLILCDPDYREPEHYAALTANWHVLKPGASILAQTGHIYAYDNETAMVIEAVGNKELAHRPRLCEVFTGGFTQLWRDRALRNDTPFLWYERLPIMRESWPWTAFWGSKDKTRHKWGDGELAYKRLLEWFTRPGDVVLDPYTGSGTVPAVCKMLGRHYLAFEIDYDTCEMARQRVADTPEPLFVLGQADEQLEMDLLPVEVAE